MSDAATSGAAELSLPVELLQRVLQLACRDGALPTAAYAACVSRYWRDCVLGCEADLYQVADFSFGWVKLKDAPLLSLCARRALSKTRTLRLCGQPLSERALGALSSACRSLAALELDGCTLPADAAVALVAAQHQLSTLSLTRCELKAEGLVGALQAAAESLQRLSLAGCPRVNSRVLSALPCCTRLTSLDLTAAAGGLPAALQLPLEALQERCPGLQTLSLSGLAERGGWSLARAPPGEPPAGWLRLRVLHVSSSRRLTELGARLAASAVDDAALARLARGAAALRELAVGGTRVTAAGLAALPCTALEGLHMEYSPAACDAGAAYAAVRWADSLRAVSCAAGSDGALTDEGLRSLAACAQLRALDVSGSTFGDAALRDALRALPRLKSLDCASCRGLSRPVRQAALDGLEPLRRALALAA